MTPEEYKKALEDEQIKLKAKIKEDLAKIKVFEIGEDLLEFQEIKDEDIPHRYDRQKCLKRMLSQVKKCECGQIGYERWIKTRVNHVHHQRWDFDKHSKDAEKGKVEWKPDGWEKYKLPSQRIDYLDYTICKVLCDSCYEPYRQENQ